MIARELLVKLGFDIDSAKLDKFSSMVDDTKNKMMSLKQGVMSNISPDISAKFNELKSYQDELASLSKSEKTEILSLNRLEKQAIRETTKLEKDELKERQRLVKESFKERQQLRLAELKNFQNSINLISRKFAIIGASITAGFGLSIRSTLKDAANFKKGKSSAGTFDKNQIAAVDSFNKSLDTTKSLIANLRNGFVVDMLPAIKETLEVFNVWVQKNKALIQEKLKDIIVGLAGAFKILSSVIGQVLSVLDFIISKTIGWRSVITAVISLGVAAWFISLSSSVLAAARAFKVFALAIYANPLVLIITAIVAALVLLVDEIYVTIQGGNSLINDFLKSDAWNAFKMGINAIVDSLKSMWEWLIKVKDGILNFPSNVTTKISGLIDVGKNKFNNLFSSDNGKLGEGNVKRYSIPKYEPEEVKKVFASSVTNNAREANVTNKNTFSMNITVPSGTEEKQAIYIGKVVKDELEKYNVFQTEQTLASIGSY